MFVCFLGGWGGCFVFWGEGLFIYLFLSFLSTELCDHKSFLGFSVIESGLVAYREIKILEIIFCFQFSKEGQYYIILSC